MSKSKDVSPLIKELQEIKELCQNRLHPVALPQGTQDIPTHLLDLKSNLEKACVKAGNVRSQLERSLEISLSKY
jgi:hypothetical protein